MPSPVLTLSQFATTSYLPWAAARKRSWRVDERILRQHVLPQLGKMQLRLIRPDCLHAWFLRLPEAGLAPCSCNRVLAVVKKLFALAQELDALPGPSPARGLRFLPVPPRPERFLKPAEARHLANALKASGRPEALAALLLLHTGARKSEILKARWEHLDLQRGILTVPLAKSGRQRHVLLSDEACGLIARLPSRDRSDWLFPSRNPDRPLSDIYRFWDRLRHQLGLENVRLHDLRHTFASLVVNSGNSLYHAQRLLGHMSPTTTMRYAHLEKSGLLGICNAISARLGQGPAMRPVLTTPRQMKVRARPWQQKMALRPRRPLSGKVKKKKRRDSIYVSAG